MNDMTASHRGLTEKQIETLLRPLNPGRVLVQQNQSHLPAFDVTAHLTRIFGFGGWQKEVLDISVVSEDATETSGGKPAWQVTYRCLMRLTIRDPHGNVLMQIDDGACGSSKQPQRGEAHDMAYKSAISYALKRCAKDLGDQFGLSLYNAGSVEPLVVNTLVVSADAEVEAPSQAPRSMGNDEGEGTGQHQDDDAGEVLQRIVPMDQAFELVSEVVEGDQDLVKWAFRLQGIELEEGGAIPRGRVKKLVNFAASEKPITEQQTKRIHVLKKELGLSDEKYRAGLKSIGGVETSKDLTERSAAAVITKLDSLLKEKKAAAQKGEQA